MKKTYITPEGYSYSLYADMLQQTHVLIGGATGSGKSVVINGFLHTALLQSPALYQFILIDLKRVELYEYKDLPHTLSYADSITSALSALQQALDLIQARYNAMQAAGLRKYNGSCVYVVIDELADLMTVDSQAGSQLAYLHIGMTTEIGLGLEARIPLMGHSLR